MFEDLGDILTPTKEAQIQVTNIEDTILSQQQQPRHESEEEPNEIDDNGEALEEIVPLQLRRQLLFKRGNACRALLVINDLIFVDGLNGNVDAFRIDDLMYAGTLDINESGMTCSLTYQEQDRTLILIGTTQVIRFQ